MKTFSLVLFIIVNLVYHYSIGQEAIIVKFNYAMLDFSFIDDDSKVKSRLEDIFNNKESDLKRNFFSSNPLAKDIKVEKIFPNLTTKDTVSVSRLGENITVPPFWACFRVFVEKEKIFEFIEIFNEYPKLIDYVHFDYQAVPLNTPNDDLYDMQLGLFDPNGNADINIEEAWTYTTGKNFIKVAVHDNGIDSIHPDLEVLTGGGYWNNEQQSLADWGTELTGIPHGTPVAGIIGAKRNNEIGIAGIAGGDGSDTAGVSLIDIKYPFLTKSGVSYILAGVVDAARVVGTYFDYGEDYYSSAVDSSHYYFNSSIGFGAHISNHSYAIVTEIPKIEEEEENKDIQSDSSAVVSTSNCELCREAFLFSLQNGVINVVARGNNAQLNAENTAPTSVEHLYPQSAPDNWIISVGASALDGNTVQEGVNEDPSEVGFYSLYGGNMDIVAPGSNAIVHSTIGSSVNDEYRPFNGTSAAAPHASGVAALLLSYHNKDCYSNKNLSIEDVEYILEKSATDLNDPGYDQLSGWGRLNAGEALKMIGEPTKQIVHPDSLLNSEVIEEDTILLAYHRAFVGNDWGPISQQIPLERERQYQVVRVLVENTYSIDEFITPQTQIIDSWARPSASNATEFYRDTVEQVVFGPMGQPLDGYNFKIFNQTPFDSITDVDLTNNTIKVVGYYYRFLKGLLEIDYSVSNENVITTNNLFFDPDLNNLNFWYPTNPLNNNARLAISLYLEDPTFTSYFDAPCDSLNLPYDDTVITEPLNTSFYEQQTWNVFPNPGEHQVNISLHETPINGSLLVTDITGKETHQITLRDRNTTIDISAWAKGCYIFRYNSENESLTHKFIKR